MRNNLKQKKQTYLRYACGAYAIRKRSASWVQWELPLNIKNGCSKRV